MIRPQGDVVAKLSCFITRRFDVLKFCFDVFVFKIMIEAYGVPPFFVCMLVAQASLV